MSRRGPAPKPTVLKILAGNPGRRPLNKREPQPPADCPPCPKGLGKEAQAEWNRITPLLGKLKLLTLADLGSLTGYCIAFGQVIEAMRRIEKDGEFIEDPVFNKNGKKVGSRTKVHPAVALLNQADERMNRHLSKFGLSPADRTRLTSTTSHDDTKSDPLQALIDQSKRARHA